MNWTHLWIKHQVSDTGSGSLLLFEICCTLSLWIAELELTPKWKKAQCSYTLHSQFMFWSFSVTSESRICNIQCAPCNEGAHWNWSDALIASLFAAQVQYGLGHYHSHYPLVANNRIGTLYESAIAYKSVNCCKIRVARLCVFFFSCLTSFQKLQADENSLFMYLFIVKRGLLTLQGHSNRWVNTLLTEM